MCACLVDRLVTQLHEGKVYRKKATILPHFAEQLKLEIRDLCDFDFILLTGSTGWTGYYHNQAIRILEDSSILGHFVGFR